LVWVLVGGEGGGFTVVVGEGPGHVRGLPWHAWAHDWVPVRKLLHHEQLEALQLLQSVFM